MTPPFYDITCVPALYVGKAPLIVPGKERSVSLVAIVKPSSFTTLVVK